MVEGVAELLPWCRQLPQASDFEHRGRICCLASAAAYARIVCNQAGPNSLCSWDDTDHWQHAKNILASYISSSIKFINVLDIRLRSTGRKIQSRS